MSDDTRPQRFGSMEGETYSLGELTLAFKRRATQDEGAYSMFESLEPPGAHVAFHRHPRFQETFLVLDGTFEFQIADERHRLAPGDLLVIPRGAAHGFRCTSSAAGRLLTISTPARLFEAFVRDISAANSTGRAADAQAAFERHGVELL